MKRLQRPSVPTDEAFMQECLRLARKGMGNVEPNPMVGAVIVRKGKVIGRGYHREFGGPHAEVRAIRSCRGIAKGATLYVNLEPCVHHGKTPPCTDAIIAAGIREVVVGMRDPNPVVAGKGLRALRNAGIRVRTNVLRPGCERLNESFTKYVTSGLPFVTLKIAQSTDGRIADLHGRSQWITGEQARVDVHRLRAASVSVMVGARTVVKDDPRLTVRHVSGAQPLRVVLDGALVVRPDARVFTSLRSSPTILVTRTSSARRRNRTVSALRKKGVTIVAFDVPRNRAIPVRAVLSVLGGMGITSVLVEGGAETWGRFLNEQCADKLVLYTSQMLIGGGAGAFGGLKPGSLSSAIELRSVSASIIGADIRVEGYLSYRKRR